MKYFVTPDESGLFKQSDFAKSIADYKKQVQDKINSLNANTNTNTNTNQGKSLYNYPTFRKADSSFREKWIEDPKAQQTRIDQVEPYIHTYNAEAGIKRRFKLNNATAKLGNLLRHRQEDDYKYIPGRGVVNRSAGNAVVMDDVGYKLLRHDVSKRTKKKYKNVNEIFDDATNMDIFNAPSVALEGKNDSDYSRSMRYTPTKAERENILVNARRLYDENGMKPGVAAGWTHVEKGNAKPDLFRAASRGYLGRSNTINTIRFDPKKAIEYAESMIKANKRDDELLMNKELAQFRKNHPYLSKYTFATYDTVAKNLIRNNGAGYLRFRTPRKHLEDGRLNPNYYENKAFYAKQYLENLEKRRLAHRRKLEPAMKRMGFAPYETSKTLMTPENLAALRDYHIKQIRLEQAKNINSGKLDLGKIDWTPKNMAQAFGFVKTDQTSKTSPQQNSQRVPLALKTVRGRHVRDYYNRGIKLLKQQGSKNKTSEMLNQIDKNLKKTRVNRVANNSNMNNITTD